MYNLEFRSGRRSFWNSQGHLERELDKFFAGGTQGEDLYTPVCEVSDEKNQYTVSVDIPGIKKDEISIEIKDNHLYVTGERKYVSKAEEESILRTERRYGKFSRVFTLPQDVKAEAIEARFENGVLDIVLPKEEKSQARKISISNWKESDSSVKN